MPHPDAACPACAARRIAAVVSVLDYEYRVRDGATYATCADCGTVFQDPMPDEAALSSYYPPQYHSMSSAGFIQNLRNDLRLATLRKRLAVPGAILDYGCGSGTFMLHAARKLPNREFIGYEIGAPASIRDLENGRVRIVQGTIDDLLPILPNCAVITMNHVIEHLPDPFDTVARLLPHLLPGGWFEGQTPAAASLEHRVFGARWSGYHAPRHTVVFSPAGMKTFLARAGLDSIDTSAGFNPAGIAVSLASAFAGARPGGIQRHGLQWTFWLGMAAALGPLDYFSGRSGILNFAARKPA